MNRNCHGDHFKADGAMYYRCSGGGTVVAGTSNGEPCPACGREVDGFDSGVLEVTTLVKRYAILPDGREAVLSTTKS